jgi:hypothetical protein
MDKKQVLETFNTHFNEFLEDVSLVFPENTDIPLMKKAISILNMMSKKHLISTFKTNIVDCYSKEIKDGDISFFINKDYKKDLQNIGAGASSSMIMDKIDQLKLLVKDMSHVDQQKALKYIQNLTELCNIYYSLE